MSAGEWILLIVLATGALLLVWWWLHRGEGSLALPALTPPPASDATPADAGAPVALPEGREQEQPAPVQATPLVAEPAVADTTAQDAAAPLPDNLIVIAGIGHKLNAVLRAAGITTYAELARREPAELKRIAAKSGIHIAMPTTWAEQAALAAAGRWPELRELQQRLKEERQA